MPQLQYDFHIPTPEYMEQYNDEAGARQAECVTETPALVCMDRYSWHRSLVDVAERASVQSSDFQAHTGCDASSKIVESDLPGQTTLNVQLDGSPKQLIL